LGKNGSPSLEQIAEYIFQLLSPYIQKLEYRLKALEERLPSRVQVISDLKPLNKGTVLVDFYGEWCLPCFEIMPIIEKLAIEFQDKPIKFYRIDVDKTKEAIPRFRIEAIPLILLIRDGTVIERLEGVPRKKAYDILRWMVLRGLVPEDEWRKTYEFAERVASRMGWKLHPEKIIRDGLIAALTWNKLQHGAYYCPCKPEKVPQNICPCKPYKNYPGSIERIKREGICHCNLFVSQEYYKRYTSKYKETK